MRNNARVRRAVMGPSPLFAACGIFRLLVRPLPLVLVLALIISAEASSRASLLREHELAEPAADTNEIEGSLKALEQTPALPEAVVDEQDTAIAAADDLLAKAAVSVKDAAEPLPALVQPQEPVLPKAALSLDPHLGLIEFISGVIAVYYPEIKDPGIIARQIVEQSQAENMDPLFIASITATESSFKPHARSHKGAMGLMQLKPSTAREVLQKRLGGKGAPQLSDPAVNLRLGIHYLKQLERHYRSNRALALAAYNWGPANLDEALRSRSQVPSSVKQYARSILEKTHRWNSHFKNAAQHARKFSAQGANNS